MQNNILKIAKMQKIKKNSMSFFYYETVNILSLSS